MINKINLYNQHKKIALDILGFDAYYGSNDTGGYRAQCSIAESALIFNELDPSPEVFFHEVCHAYDYSYLGVMVADFKNLNVECYSSYLISQFLGEPLPEIRDYDVECVVEYFVDVATQILLIELGINKEFDHEALIRIFYHFFEVEDLYGVDFVNILNEEIRSFVDFTLLAQSNNCYNYAKNYGYYASPVVKDYCKSVHPIVKSL